MEFNEKLKILRERAGYTQAEVAEKIGTTQQQYGKYELGIQEPRAGRLKAICELYGASADYLLNIKPKKDQ